MQDFRMTSSRVGPDGGAALAQGLLSASSLTALDLSDNPMTAEAASPLATLVLNQPHLRYNLNTFCLHAACQLIEHDYSPQFSDGVAYIQLSLTPLVLKTWL